MPVSFPDLEHTHRLTIGDEEISEEYMCKHQHKGGSRPHRHNKDGQAEYFNYDPDAPSVFGEFMPAIARPETRKPASGHGRQVGFGTGQAKLRMIESEEM